MSLDITLLQGSLVNQYCGADYLTNHFVSYGLLLILTVALLWGMMKKNNYTIHTALPVTFFANFILSLFLWSLNCSLEPAVSGKFVIICLVLTGLTVSFRIALDQ